MMRWLPENVSTFGPGIDEMFSLIFAITTGAFVLVLVPMVAFLIMYRHREGRRATYTHGNSTLEIIWSVVPAVVLITLGVMSKAKWDEIKTHVPPADVQVRITAKQFNWEVMYPGPDGRFDTDDDVQFDNRVHVPVDKVVQVLLRSKDVIHSLFVPALRLKQDALPGREVVVWFQATTPGTYEIPCAELCGFGHSGMNGALVVHDAASYDAWLKERWPASEDVASRTTEPQEG